MNEPFQYNMALDMCSVDFTGHWQPGAIFRGMQNASSAHCVELHASYEELLAQGLAWVLSRALLVMEEYPVLDDALTIHTWPTTTRHSLFPRHYTFEKQGKIIGRATTMYVLLDLETRKVAPASRLSVPMTYCELPAPLPMPGSLQTLEGEPLRVDYKPVYTDLDMNRHVNNTRYIDWFMDRFPYEKHQQEELKRLLVHYNFEVRPDEPVTLCLKNQDSLSALQGLNGDQVCFAVEGEWRKREQAD